MFLHGSKDLCRTAYLYGSDRLPSFVRASLLVYCSSVLHWQNENDYSRSLGDRWVSPYLAINRWKFCTQIHGCCFKTAFCSSSSYIIKPIYTCYRASCENQWNTESFCSFTAACFTFALNTDLTVSQTLSNEPDWNSVLAATEDVTEHTLTPRKTLRSQRAKRRLK